MKVNFSNKEIWYAFNIICRYGAEYGGADFPNESVLIIEKVLEELLKEKNPNV